MYDVILPYADYIYLSPSINPFEGRAREDLLILQNLTKNYWLTSLIIVIVACGFSGKSLYWQCPGCKQWNGKISRQPG